MGFFRKAYSIVAALLLLDVVVQFFLIGAAIFTLVGEASNGTPAQKSFDDSGVYFAAHAINGAGLAILILLMVGLSFGSRFPWRTTGLTALLFLLLAIQSVLAHTGIALVSAFHVINGLVILGLVGYLTRSNWAFGAKPPVPEAQSAVTIGS
jgi:hypothetical protein